MTNEEAKAFLDNLKICIEEHPVVADWLVEIADRKDTADTPQTDWHYDEQDATWYPYKHEDEPRIGKRHSD